MSRDVRYFNLFPPAVQSLHAIALGLPKESVVNVTQVYTVDKGALIDKIGALSKARVRQILEGLSRVLTPLDV